MKKGVQNFRIVVREGDIDAQLFHRLMHRAHASRREGALGQQQVTPLDAFERVKFDRHAPAFELRYLHRSFDPELAVSEFLEKCDVEHGRTCDGGPCLKIVTHSPWTYKPLTALIDQFPM
jgi:hypothetical protein